MISKATKSWVGGQASAEGGIHGISEVGEVKGEGLLSNEIRWESVNSDGSVSNWRWVNSEIVMGVVQVENEEGGRVARLDRAVRGSSESAGVSRGLRR